MSAVRDSFIAWIKLALPELNSVARVKQRFADVAVGEDPCAVIYFPSSQGTEYGTPTIDTTDTESGEVPGQFIQTRDRLQYGTLLVEIFSDNADELIESLEMSISDPTISQWLKDADIAVGATLGIQDTTELRANSHARSVQVDFRVSWNVHREAAVPVIETATFALTT